LGNRKTPCEINHMEIALERIGLPVKCRKCGKKGNVRPRTDYGGWHKSRFMLRSMNKWFCPEHAQIGKDMDKRFTMKFEPPAKKEDVKENLYKLLED
jgi:hypothetical protein